MKQDKIVLSLLIVANILVILFVTNVGYAVDNDKVLRISNEKFLKSHQREFDVVFSGNPTYEGDGLAKLEITGPRTATINVTELNNIGDSVTTMFTLENKSSDLYAYINVDIVNTNPEYFNVSAILENNKISPKNGKINIEINVQLIKLPVYEENAYIDISIFTNSSN